ARRLGILICPCHLLQSAGEQVFQLRAKIEMMFLCELKRFHHFDWLGFKKILPLRVKLCVSNKEGTEFCFSAAPQRQKTKERARSARRITARELFGNAFRHPENISRVFV